MNLNIEICFRSMENSRRFSKTGQQIGRYLQYFDLLRIKEGVHYSRTYLPLTLVSPGLLLRPVQSPVKYLFSDELSIPGGLIISC